jgi:hypothetical protein
MDKENNNLLALLTPEGITFSLFFLGTVVSPGFVHFYLFNRDFFNKTDWIKLLFLSGGITLPFLIINTILFSVIFTVFKGNFQKIIKEKDFKENYMIASFTTLLTLYAGIGAGYLSHSVSVEFCIIGLIEGILVLIFFAAPAILFIKKIRRKTSSTNE